MLSSLTQSSNYELNMEHLGFYNLNMWMLQNKHVPMSKESLQVSTHIEKSVNYERKLKTPEY